MTTRLGGNSSPANHHARKAEEKALGEGEEREEGEEEGGEERKERRDGGSDGETGRGRREEGYIPILSSLTHTRAVASPYTRDCSGGREPEGAGPSPLSDSNMCPTENRHFFT